MTMPEMMHIMAADALAAGVARASSVMIYSRSDGLYSPIVYKGLNLLVITTAKALHLIHHTNEPFLTTTNCI